MTGGLIALAAALAVATALGTALRRRAVGQPRQADVIAALGSVVGPWT